MKHFFALCLIIPSLHAATFTWDGGGTNNNTTTAANWSSNVAPLHGTGGNTADWVFAGSTRTGPVLNADASIRSVTFNSSSDFVVLSGRDVILNGDVRNIGSGSAVFGGNLTLNSGIGSTLSATGANLSLTGGVDTNQRPLVLNAASQKVLSLEGRLEGGYLPQFGQVGIRKIGAGTLELFGFDTNTYTAPLLIEEGSLRLLSTGALSSSASANLVVDAGATVNLNNGVNLSNHPVDLSGTLEFTGTSLWQFTDGLSISGDNAKILATDTLGRLESVDPVVVTGDELLLEAESNGTLVIDGDLEFDSAGRNVVLFVGPSGGGGGSGVVELTGSVTKKVGTAGSLTGVVVNSGTLELNNADISAFSSVVINSSGSIEVTGGTPTLKNLSGSGDITLGSRDVVVDVTQDSFFSGDIIGGDIGGDSFEKTGSATLTVTGTVDARLNLITEGTLALDGATLLRTSSNPQVSTRVSQAGVLTGTGTADYLSFADSGTLRLGDLFGTGFLDVNTIDLKPDGVVEWSPQSWTGGAGSGWPQVRAEDLIVCSANASNPCIIRIDTGAVSDFSNGPAEFLIMEGRIITGFNSSEFEVLDVSTNPLPGTWSVRNNFLPDLGVGLVLSFTPDDPYLNWIEGFGYTGTDTDPGEDPDGDGLANGVEFVVGSSPANASQAEFPSLSVVEDEGREYLRFAFRRTKQSAYLQPEGQISVDLENWDDLSTLSGFFFDVNEIDPDTELVEQFVPHDTVLYPKRFVQLFVDYTQ